MKKENGYVEMIIIFVAILVLSTSMYAYNSAQKTIDVTKNTMYEYENMMPENYNY